MQVNMYNGLSKETQDQALDFLEDTDHDDIIDSEDDDPLRKNREISSVHQLPCA